MDRVEWLKQMRDKAETLYNHGAERWGYETDKVAAKSRDETTVQYIQKFLDTWPRKATYCQRVVERGCTTECC